MNNLSFIRPHCPLRNILCNPGTLSSIKNTTGKFGDVVFLLPSGALTQAIRNFAKSLESWLTNAMMNIPEEMVRIKVLSPCISLNKMFSETWSRLIF